MLFRSRLLPLSIQGEETKMGNRSFKLDIIENNEIIFKISREKHIKLKLPKLRKNYQKEYAAEFTYPDWQRLVLKHQPEVAGKLAEKIVIEPEVKKEFKHLFDSAELGLL